MSRKKKLMVSLALALVVALAVTGTLMLFTSETKVATNKVSVPGLRIDLYEKGPFTDEIVTDGWIPIDGDGYGLNLPITGDFTIEKQAKVVSNANSVPSYLRVLASVIWDEDKYGAYPVDDALDAFADLAEYLTDLSLVAGDPGYDTAVAYWETNEFNKLVNEFFDELLALVYASSPDFIYEPGLTAGDIGYAYYVGAGNGSGIGDGTDFGDVPLAYFFGGDTAYFLEVNGIDLDDLDDIKYAAVWDEILGMEFYIDIQAQAIQSDGNPYIAITDEYVKAFPILAAGDLTAPVYDPTVAGWMEFRPTFTTSALITGTFETGDTGVTVNVSAEIDAITTEAKYDIKYTIIDYEYDNELLRTDNVTIDADGEVTIDELPAAPGYYTFSVMAYNDAGYEIKTFYIQVVES